MEMTVALSCSDHTGNWCNVRTPVGEGETEYIIQGLAVLMRVNHELHWNTSFTEFVVA